MSTEFESIFAALRDILRKHAGTLQVTDDKPTRFCLAGATGPATVRAWGGKMKTTTIPVAWVEIGKGYVSFHLMPLYGCRELQAGLSKKLQARMQGKSCLNFKHHDEALLQELERVTVRGFEIFKKAGFISLD